MRKFLRVFQIETGECMIQDILPKKLKNEYERRRPRKEDFIVGFCDGCILIKEGNTIEFLTYDGFSSYYKSREEETPECLYLFSVDAAGYFLSDVSALRKMPGVVFCPMFEIRAKKPKECVFAAATAWHLFRWYRENRYCGCCGTKMMPGVGARKMDCPLCGNEVFPRIAPAVIVAVTDKDKILMTKYAGREYKRYALIAGFTEIGETAEDTVAREVMEEVGLEVRNITYYKSQPWGFDGNLLLGYFCEADSNAKMRMDETELSVAEWVLGSEIEDDTEGLSLTREMMTVFRDRLRVRTDH